MVVRHYGQDFRWLGYSTDPAHLLPLEKVPRCRVWSAGWDLDSGEIGKIYENQQLGSIFPTLGPSHLMVAQGCHMEV